MMRAVELVPNSARIAELWARFKAELDTKLDKWDIAADEDVGEMLTEVFGSSVGGSPAEVTETATEKEVAEMLQEVFGDAGSNKQNIATDAEVTEMLCEVFGTSQVNDSEKE